MSGGRSSLFVFCCCLFLFCFWGGGGGTGLKIKGGGQPLKLGKIGIRNKHHNYFHRGEVLTLWICHWMLIARLRGGSDPLDLPLDVDSKIEGGVLTLWICHWMLIARLRGGSDPLDLPLDVDSKIEGRF